MIDFYDDEEYDKNSDEGASDIVSDKSSKNNEKKFLGIMFNCCSVYGRIYKNKEGTAYVGRCPKCMRYLKVPVGKGGTNQRFFNAY